MIKKILLLMLIFISSNVAATKMHDNELKKYDYKIGIDLNQCGMELYVNDVMLIYNSDMNKFNTTFGIGSFLKEKNNKIRIVLLSLNKNSEIFTTGTECNFEFLARDRFESDKLNHISLISYRPNEDIDFNIKKASHYKNSNINWGELADDLKVEFVDKNNKYYRMTQQFNIREDFPAWKWTTSYQFNDNIKFFNDLPLEQQAKLKEIYTEIWDAFNRQDEKKIKLLFNEMLEESSSADGGSVESYYNSLGFSMLFDKEQYQLKPLNISSNSKISKYLDNRVISVFKSPIAFKDLESGQSIGINPKLRFDGEKFIISR
ncbi:hypothetical protein VU602_07860 [Providencia stuartii]|uniref:hypothetical protein n=1 Tax=Providencia stuartii TaxID=588 RepID=UPI003CED302E